MNPAARLKTFPVLGFAGVVAAGWVTGWAAAESLGLTQVSRSPGYLSIVTALLALGIYGSTHGIPIEEFRRNARVVLLAVTVGVMLKAALIAGVMFIFFRTPEYVLLGVVVAQIDPLAVAAMRAKCRMSDSAKALLAAWSSFDDPVTVLLTIYASVFALRARGDMGDADGVLFGGDLRAFGVNLAANLVFAGAAYAIWKLAQAVGRRLSQRVAPRELAAGHIGNAVGLLVLVFLGAIAVTNSLILGLALIGLFFRPAIGAIVERLLPAALLVAACALGLVLVDGIAFRPGLVLGIAAYGAQCLIAPLVTISQPRRDRMRLALSQQNGLTAIILALLLEPTFPGTVAVVAPAILVVNLLHAICQSAFDWIDSAAPSSHRPCEHQRNGLKAPILTPTAEPPAEPAR